MIIGTAIILLYWLWLWLSGHGAAYMLSSDVRTRHWDKGNIRNLLLREWVAASAIIVISMFSFFGFGLNTGIGALAVITYGHVLRLKALGREIELKPTYHVRWRWRCPKIFIQLGIIASCMKSHSPGYLWELYRVNIWVWVSLVAVEIGLLVYRILS